MAYVVLADCEWDCAPASPGGDGRHHLPHHGDGAPTTITSWPAEPNGSITGSRVAGVSQAPGTMTNVDITQAASSKEHAAVIYERLGEGLRDVRIRELVDDDYADLEAHVARLLACASRGA